MPYTDKTKRRAAQRDYVRRKRAAERALAATPRPAAPSAIDDLAEWLERLVVGQGPLSGQRFELLDWERRFIAGAFADGVDQSALSLGRGNGKSSLVAAIASSAICGPLAKERGEVVCVASSFSQSKIIFEHALSFLSPHIDADPDRFRVNDSASSARIEDRLTGSRLRCIGSLPKRALGLAPALVLADEPAAWAGVDSEKMFSALTTSLGKIENSRFVALGTRAASGDGWFANMLRGDAPGVYAQTHAATADDDPFDPKTWKKANPSLDSFPALAATIAREAARAAVDASLLPQFLSLRLNAGVSDILEARLLAAGTWKAIETTDALEFRGDYILGVDLGSNSAMSAASAYFPASGILDSFAIFPESPTLLDRGRADGCGNLYSEMHTRGELVLAGARVSDVPALLREAMARWGVPRVVVSDRWRESELRQALDAAQFPTSCQLVTRGQGYRDGGEDCRLFRSAVIDGRVVAPVSLLLRSAMSEARVTCDPAGNVKLSKAGEGSGRRARAKDDACASSILAVAHGTRVGASASGGPSVRLSVL